MAEKKKGGLGRGLGALIPNVLEENTVTSTRPTDVFFGTSSAKNKPAASSEKPKRKPNQRVSLGHDILGTRKSDVSRETSRKETSSTSSSVTKIPVDTSTKEVKNAETENVSRETELVPVPGAAYAEIPLELICPNLQQPRSVFVEEELNELAHSVAEVGILQPVVVRAIPENQISAGTLRRNEAIKADLTNLDVDSLPAPKYELIMGERRWRASWRAEQKVIPAVIRDTEDSDLLRDALLENLHRVNLNPLEEAAAYKQLLEDFGCTQEVLSQRIARSRPQISNTLRLLQLPSAVQKRVASGIISAGHARALLALDTAEEMEKVAEKIVADGLSVRAVEELVAAKTADEVSPISAAVMNPALESQTRQIEAKLMQILDASIAVKLGKRKSKLIINFKNNDELQRVVDTLASKLSEK